MESRLTDQRLSSCPSGCTSHQELQKKIIMWVTQQRHREQLLKQVVSCLSLDAWELLDECPLTEWVTWALGFCRGSMSFLNLLFTEWQRWLSRSSEDGSVTEEVMSTWLASMLKQINQFPASYLRVSSSPRKEKEPHNQTLHNKHSFSRIPGDLSFLSEWRQIM